MTELAGYWRWCWSGTRKRVECACVLVVSHGNTLRALVKHLDRLSVGQTAALNIPTGVPLLCRLGPDMRSVGGRYLD